MAGCSRLSSARSLSVNSRARDFFVGFKVLGGSWRFCGKWASRAGASNFPRSCSKLPALAGEETSRALASSSARAALYAARLCSASAAIFTALRRRIVVLLPPLASRITCVYSAASSAAKCGETARSERPARNATSSREGQAIRCSVACSQRQRSTSFREGAKSSQRQSAIRSMLMGGTSTLPRPRRAAAACL